MWVKQREPSLSFKGTLGQNVSRLRTAGGIDVPFIPFVGITLSEVVLWFEWVREGEIDAYNTVRRINFRALPGFQFQGGSTHELSQFDMDAWVHASDRQLKVLILHWRGDEDRDRDAYVLRTGYVDVQ